MLNLCNGCDWRRLSNVFNRMYIYRSLVCCYCFSSIFYKLVCLQYRSYLLQNQLKLRNAVYSSKIGSKFRKVLRKAVPVVVEMPRTAEMWLFLQHGCQRMVFEVTLMGLRGSMLLWNSVLLQLVNCDTLSLQSISVVGASCQSKSDSQDVGRTADGTDSKINPDRWPKCIHAQTFSGFSHGELTLLTFCASLKTDVMFVAWRSMNVKVFACGWCAWLSTKVSPFFVYFTDAGLANTF